MNHEHSEEETYFIKIVQSFYYTVTHQGVIQWIFYSNKNLNPAKQ
jgi:hypothetical protein